MLAIYFKVAVKHHNRSCSALGDKSKFIVNNGTLEVGYSYADEYVIWIDLSIAMAKEV